MTNMPTYVIEPPDILLLQTMSVVPKTPYHLKPGDGLFIQVSGTVREREIYGLYMIEPSGTVNLGLGYGTVQVDELTVDEAQQKIQDHLGKILKAATAQVSLGQSRAMQQISGIHLVRQDGTISLGLYGSVNVTNLTLEQARHAIEEHLSQFVQRPEVAVDVYVYNSKWYYIILDRAGQGQSVYRLPITGKETVLDALSNTFGTTAFPSYKEFWLARPNGADPNKFQLFPINWLAITMGASPATNYQLLPGDRIFVGANRWVAATVKINRFWGPSQAMLNSFFGQETLGASGISAMDGTVRLLAQPANSAATGTLLPGGIGSVGIVGR
jgi:polysaccharide export outer membrane protein